MQTEISKHANETNEWKAEWTNHLSKQTNQSYLLNLYTLEFLFVCSFVQKFQDFVHVLLHFVHALTAFK